MFVETVCENDGRVFRQPEATGGRVLAVECPVCVQLGPRSLIRFMRSIQGQSPERVAELRAEFATARGRSWTRRERARAVAADRDARMLEEG